MAIVEEYREGRRETMIVNLEAMRGRGRRLREVVDESQLATATVLGMTSAPILVEDDEDDVEVSSPRSFAQASLRARLHSTRQAVEEDPLELRLGTGSRVSENSVQSISAQQPRHGRRGRPAWPTIDLTISSRTSAANDDCVVILDYTKSKKRKTCVPVEPSVMKEAPPATPVQEPEPYKLNCAICMDTMKEETSTICGHIFCRHCIQEAILSQKKCPTCRKKLTMKNTHRIYL